MRRAALAFVLAALAAPATAADDAPPAAALRDAWISLPAPGVRVAAGYVVIDNPAAAPLQVVGVRAAGFARAEVHEVVRDGDRMRMRPRPTLEVAARSRVALAPGGLHLMLFDPALPPRTGAAHELTLLLADGRELRARAVVRDPRDASAARR